MVSETFTIKKGQHYSNRWFKKLIWFFTQGRCMELNFTFNQSDLLYECDDPEGWGLQWNKLFGLTSWNIHDTSIRLVWRTRKDKVEYALYMYVDGKRYIYPIECTFDNSSTIEAKLSLLNNLAIITLRNKKTVQSMACSFPSPKQAMWFAYPYFGGKVPANKTFKINLIIK